VNDLPPGILYDWRPFRVELWRGGFGVELKRQSCSSLPPCSGACAKPKAAPTAISRKPLPRPIQPWAMSSKHLAPSPTTRQPGSSHHRAGWVRSRSTGAMGRLCLIFPHTACSPAGSRTQWFVAWTSAASLLQVRDCSPRIHLHHRGGSDKHPLSDTFDLQEDAALLRYPHNPFPIA
jgi:hypothetical protein